jgi:GAF domain-containing protein
MLTDSSDPARAAGTTPIETDAAETWDAAPCGLLRLDADGLIIAANAELLAWTGYGAAALVDKLYWPELLGGGSRLFYQTQLAPVLELDGVLTEVMIDLLAADGSRVPALLNATRLGGDGGGTSGVRIALMTVADRRAYESDLRQAREAAIAASAADSQARQRLELLASANTALASSTDIEIALAGLARVLVARLADWAVIYAGDPDEPTRPPQWAVAHIDPQLEADLQRLGALLPQHTQPSSALHQVLTGGAPVLLTEITDDYRRQSTASDEVRRLYQTVGLASGMVVPATSRGTRVVTVITGRGEGQPPFTAQDLAVLTDLGARCGIVFDNLWRHSREHNNSVALQQALLTAPPATPHLQVAIRYLPASDGNAVGGDWYDAFVQPDGTAVVVIGDVMGHDIVAAAAMGQLRAALRTIGYTHAGTPAEILSHTDSATQALGVNTFATTLVARIEPQPDGSALLRASSAGHPPPILIRREGAVSTIDVPADPPLGIGASSLRHDHTFPLAVGDTVLLYTDGLVERTDEDIDTSVDRLVIALAGTESWSVDDITDWSLSGRRNARRDDIALLAFRLF